MHGMRSQAHRFCCVLGCCVHLLGTPAGRAAAAALAVTRAAPSPLGYELPANVHLMSLQPWTSAHPDTAALPRAAQQALRSGRARQLLLPQLPSDSRAAANASSLPPTAAGPLLPSCSSMTHWPYAMPPLPARLHCMPLMLTASMASVCEAAGGCGPPTAASARKEKAPPPAAGMRSWPLQAGGA